MYKLENIEDDKLFLYLKKLIKDDYEIRIKSLHWKYGKTLLTYIQNYIFTKLKLLKNKKI